MTKIALISDIHGNQTALEAVLEDIHTRGIERIFCLGDLVGKGPRGSECIELIQKHCEKVIRGNWDVFIRDETDNEFINWFQERLSEDDNEYLASLPFHIDVELNGQLVRCIHASPRSVFERIAPEYHPEETCLSMFENSKETSSGVRKPDMVFYGDIHTTLLKTYEIGTLCNVGSVGNSLDLTSASYAILDGSYATNSVQFVRVPYDREAELKMAKELGLAGYEQYYGEIMFAKYRGAKK
ncbi:metallophosphoesterase family protein [Ornithinibacillus salinisoli]|uniref:Metallophosphoesterase family protein n=1 Tax=Ornithinibacillus salinisoli TaxID=1848459 RepID=A0ABW4VY85_9BACI